MNCGQLLVLLAFIATASTVCAKKGFGAGEQDWGYVDVRKGVHMFYWLHFTTANVTNYTERPLVIWLQGGPGASSTGYGNFEELGPLDINGNERNWTWVKEVNVLFIDNPVGSGFSYVDNLRDLTTNNTQIARDLVELMKGFYKNHPKFEKVPLHIFCESYGGKMAPEFAWELHRAIQKNQIKSNFSSVALGDPWTSPMDSVMAWAPFLLYLGIVDQDGHDKIMVAANKTGESVKRGEWTKATTEWSITQSVLLRESKGVDFYNILKPTRGDAYPRMLSRNNNHLEQMYRTLVRYDLDEDLDQKLEILMRGPVSKALGIPANVIWGSQSQATFRHLMGDFMKPVIDVVNKLLDETDLKVSVYSGQLDLICATPGTVDWIAKLRWNNHSEYLVAPRTSINVDGVLQGYQKYAGKFSMFWIDRAGHMVPADNPPAMQYVLNKHISMKN